MSYPPRRSIASPAGCSCQADEEDEELRLFAPSGIVTLLTDFGSQDTYVGQMKGAILSIDPYLRIVDLTHEIQPQDVDDGAFHLLAAVDAFPSGSVHVAVVDPGVGTDRKAIAILANGSIYIGPDNGLFNHLIPVAERAFEIRHPKVLRPTVTATFHGRDIFAPAAAYLASGFLETSELGPEVAIESLIRLEAAIDVDSNQASGRVVSIDRFGNCITLLEERDIAFAGRHAIISCNGFRVTTMARTFGEVDRGEAVAYIGSAGTLELAVREGNAALQFGIVRGDQVVVRLAESPYSSHDLAR
jgi:S-adenosyl-L-methionine hydrolase (adenosine-forming)